MQVEPGAILNSRYEVVVKVADGGMGELYYVRDLKLNGIVRALKMIKPSYAAAGWQQLLEQEAYFLTRLHHRCLPDIFDFEEVTRITRAIEGATEATGEATEAVGEHRRSFLVMEWIDGIHLGQLLQRARHTITLSCLHYIATEVLSALAYLHSQRPSIIHRDLKPSNIMVARDGTVRLIDFGISKQGGQESGYKQQFGTRGYCAPEQLRGRQTDERSDIYSFGAILLAMLGIDPVTYVAHHSHEHELARRLRSIPKGLRQLIIDCLQLEPQHRPNNVTDVAQRLNELAERNEWQSDKLTIRQLVSLVQGNSARQLGGRIAVIGAHAGAGATLVSLALAHCCNVKGIKHYYIEHGRGADSDQPGSDLQQTLELCTLQSAAQNVLIDYSSHWQPDHIEDMLSNADWIIIVSSPWIVSDRQHMSKLQSLLQHAAIEKLPVIWLSNRDQPFRDRSRWHKLSAGLTHLKLPELQAKSILHSLWTSGRFEPDATIVKELSKYLMPLIKKVIYLQ